MGGWARSCGVLVELKEFLKWRGNGKEKRWKMDENDLIDQRGDK